MRLSCFSLLNLLFLYPFAVLSFSKFQYKKSLNHDRLPLFSKSSGKGFGRQKVIETNVSVDDSEPKLEVDITQTSSSINNEDSQQPLRITQTSSQRQSTSKENMQKAVKSLKNSNLDPNNIDDVIESTDMFKKRREARENTLRENIQKLKEEEDLIATDPSVGAVPELVANRMLGRIVAFFGIPVFGGLSIFVGAFFASKKYNIDIPPSVVAYATQFPFVIGLMGISYAILSSSWDEEPGSLLGINELKTNFKRIQDGVARTKENAELREDIEKERELLNKRK